jgi:hypothetical protein
LTITTARAAMALAHAADRLARAQHAAAQVDGPHARKALGTHRLDSGFDIDDAALLTRPCSGPSSHRPCETSPRSAPHRPRRHDDDRAPPSCTHLGCDSFSGGALAPVVHRDVPAGLRGKRAVAAPMPRLAPVISRLRFGHEPPKDKGPDRWSSLGIVRETPYSIWKTSFKLEALRLAAGFELPLVQRGGRGLVEDLGLGRRGFDDRDLGHSRRCRRSTTWL